MARISAEDMAEYGMAVAARYRCEPRDYVEHIPLSLTGRILQHARVLRGRLTGALGVLTGELIAVPEDDLY